MTSSPCASESACLSAEVAATRQVTLRQSVEATGSVSCDLRKVKQVVVNLVQNALDATSGGGTVEVRVSDASSGDEGVVIEVIDEGAGLAEEVRGRLFTAGVTSKAAGSGLGLVIARAIAQQHGGSVDLVERPEGGCRAVFWLPTRPPSEAGT